MGQVTGIEWCHHTFNPWRGCTKVSPGCAHCYAETLSARNPKVLGTWGPNGTRVIASESYWRQPLKWDAEARAAGERRRVFCASLADVFEDRPELVAPRARLFRLIGGTENLDWLLLTKRPENAGRMIDVQSSAPFIVHDSKSGARHERWTTYQKMGIKSDKLWPNIWLGVSVEDQQRADERIPLLLQTPAAVRFLSCEPLLGPVDLLQVDTGRTWPGKAETSKLDALHGCTSSFREKLVLGGITEEKVKTSFIDTQNEGRIGWVIVGSESGPKRRPMQAAWAESLQLQCDGSGVSFFMKQLDVNGRVTGDLADFPPALRVREFPEPSHA